MKNPLGKCWITAGAVLWIVGILLAAGNIRQDKSGADAAKSALLQVQAQVTASADTTETSSQEGGLREEYALDTSEEETLIFSQGNTYLGTLSIPSLGLELPVLSEWSYANLKQAPCRYQGTVADGNLILAAHNYRSHFGTIGQLSSGDLLYFTDGNGTVHTYEVVQTELIAGHDTEAMEANEETWDITLFTCTWSGINRVTVRGVEV